MNPLEFHKQELAKLQCELREANRLRNNVKNRIQEKLKDINALTDNGIKHVKTDLVSRDIEICAEFINKNPGCTSKDIMDHLDSHLADQLKRWKKLDSNIFMAIMGSNLKNTNRFTTDTVTAGIPARRTTVWRCK